MLLLYATGLRVGEALALRCCDVELSQRLLTVWRAKFFKSRLIPFGQDLARVLKAFRDRRNTFPLPDDERSAFFATRAGKPIHLARVEAAFDRIRTEEGIRRSDTDTHRPRIHDLRATFAVHQASFYASFAFDPSWTFDALLITFIGVAGTVLGPLIGAVFYIVVREQLTVSFTQFHHIIFGMLFIVVVLLLPGGLIDLSQRVSRLRRRAGR